MQKRTAITPTREEDYPAWYQSVIRAADLAENSPVRGCMIIKPWGYALWERLRDRLDRAIKDTGHSNFYFPLFVPLSLMEKEAAHVDGFAKECAVVTHHRLVGTGDGKLVPDGPLEDPLVVRPTSEVVIGEAYARWIQSYRDLPILGNQWANVVRWEMRPRLLLRTSEFLWQEGHTAHATREEALVETEKMLDVYDQLCEHFLAMPVVKGTKTAGEKFPGADVTYCIEAMMQDGKALQAGTSHFLGQNFAKAFDITFLSQEGTQEHVWTTSWGVTTRLLGSLLMCHSDDNGLVLPPTIAPLQVVIVPLTQRAKDPEALKAYVHNLADRLKSTTYDDEPVRVLVDEKDQRPGDKMWHWVKKGVPILLEVGEREMTAATLVVRRRDEDPSEKHTLSHDDVTNGICEMLTTIQRTLFERAHAFQQKRTHTAHDQDAFFRYYDKGNPDVFVLAHWAGDEATEALLKDKLKVTARCIPLHTRNQRGRCLFTGQDDVPLTLFARAY